MDDFKFLIFFNYKREVEMEMLSAGIKKEHLVGIDALLKKI